MTKTYIKEYWYISKSGLLRCSQYMTIGMALFMFLVGKYIGTTLEILIFVLSGIGHMSDFDSNKYVVNYSLPISMKRRLHILYFNTIVASLLSLFMINLRCYIDGECRSIIINLFVFLMEIIGCDLHYYLFASPEFKKDILDDNRGQFIYQCVIGALIGIVIGVKLRQVRQFSLGRFIENLEFTYGIILIAIILVFAIWWTRCSMRRFERVIRNG